MRRLLLAAILLAPPLFAQDPMAISANNAAARIDGAPSINLVDYSAVQTQGTFLGAPVGANGPPTFRLFADGDNVILGQGSTPGAQQASNSNFNIAGKGIAANFEVPSAGKYCGTSLACWTMTSTDGRIVGQTNAGNNTFALGLGGNASTNALLNTSTTETVVTTIGGNPWPFRMTQWRNGTSADTSAAITLATTATYSSSYRACDATSNNVAYTLPTAANTGAFFIIKKVDTSANTCTITRASSDLIDGLTTVTLANRGDFIIIHDSSNSNVAWQIVGGNVFGQGNTTDGQPSCSAQLITPNGASMKTCQISELITIAAAATTNSANNLLVANSQILGVSARVTVVIPTATTFTIGSVSDAGRFCGTYGGSTYAAMAVAANTTSVCNNFLDPTGATATGGPGQLSAGTILITPVGGTPAAATGRVRVTVYYQQFVAPTS